MSEGRNCVQLLGNLGADPELRSGVLKLRVATTEVWFDKDKAKQERTEWHNVTVFGPRGEGLANILHKGEKIFIEGRLQTSSYEKDGQKVYKTEVIATNVIPLSLKGDGAGAGTTTKATSKGKKSRDDDDSLPF